MLGKHSTEFLDILGRYRGEEGRVYFLSTERAVARLQSVIIIIGVVVVVVVVVVDVDLILIV